jgi:glycosyltransferase involved in cell wall biosynthesis
MSVSVVIPCYNQGRFLGEAIASAAAQHGLVSKIVVVDDGSADDTPAVGTRDGSVRYLRQERKGLSEASYFRLARVVQRIHCLPRRRRPAPAPGR